MEVELVDQVRSEVGRLEDDLADLRQRCDDKAKELEEFRSALYFKGIMPKLVILFEDGVRVRIDTREALEALQELLGAEIDRRMQDAGRTPRSIEAERRFWRFTRPDEPLPEELSEEYIASHEMDGLQTVFFPQVQTVTGPIPARRGRPPKRAECVAERH